jgi:predicted nucleic acid-binding protein
MIVEMLVLPLQIVSVTSLLPRALQIGLIYQLAIYDSMYIALALDMNCPLITVDARQFNAATACGVVIKPITDFSA